MPYSSKVTYNSSPRHYPPCHFPPRPRAHSWRKAAHLIRTAVARPQEAKTTGSSSSSRSRSSSRSSSEHGEWCVRACARGAWSTLLQLDHAVPAAHVRQRWKAHNHSRRMPHGTSASNTRRERADIRSHARARAQRQTSRHECTHAHAHAHRIEHARAVRFVGCTQADGPEAHLRAACTRRWKAAQSDL